ncbi:MAG TPA: MFS transporter [Alphaproteobacteria bacterium]|nr:MFS transporter [Alphaproteobacteria bacterium]
MSVQRGFWLAVICGALILTLATGLRATFGLFLKPISLDLSMSRELFGFGIALQNLLWGAASPLFGGIADKYGTGRAVAVGALCYAAGLVLMGYAMGGSTVILANILVGIALAGSGFSVVLGAIGRASPPEKRSMALGIITAGGSFGQFAMVPYAHLLIEALDWRMALVGLAITSLIMLPAIPPVAKVQSVAPVGAPQTLRQALDEAFAHKGFWLLTAGFFVCGFQLVFIATHLPAFLADRGMPTWVGAWTLALVGLFNIVGSYGCGLLGGRYSKKNLLAVVYSLRSLVFVLFMVMPLSEYSVLLFGALMGLLWLGTVPLTSGLVAQIFGPAYMSMLYGVVFFSHQVGSFLGAWMGGFFYDVFGSYEAMWWFSVALGFAASLLHLPIVERPVPRLAAAAAPAR